MPKKGFGSSVGSLKKLKAQLKKSGGGDRPVTFVPKEGITVRFLQEPTEFWKYEECWNNDTKKSFPYADGMKEGEDYTRKSTIFLANAVNVENDKVIALQIKSSVLNRLVIKFEKYGTIKDRDYEISKYGSGLDTEYDVEGEERKKRNLDKYELIDLEDAVRRAYEAVFGSDDDDEEDDDEDEVPPRPGKRRQMRRGFSNDEDDDDDDDDDEDEDEEEEKPRKKKKRPVPTPPKRKKVTKPTTSKKRRK